MALLLRADLPARRLAPLLRELSEAGRPRSGVALSSVRKVGDTTVDIVDRDSGGLAADGFGVAVEPPLDLGLERNLASFERLLLFALPVDGRAMLLTFTVEVAEDEFGLLEERARSRHSATLAIGEPSLLKRPSS